ncbi:MAG: hypothetical protein P8X48_02715 [Acidiferrobacteraceae bacterium]|jgi:hypothetical protein
MQNFGKLVDTVQQNCHISDAQYAGYYTMCVFLLKMREYYRWENGIPLTEPLPREGVGNWLVEREHAWNELDEMAFARIPVDSSDHDPFDAGSINRKLVPAGYVYSGGTGLYSKPHFFLGDLVRQEQVGDVRILVSGKEYARDLVAPPSMYRDQTVYVRQESLRRFLWERIEEWQFQKQNPERPMAHVMDLYAQPDLERVLDEMTENETESLILHEVGEAEAGRLLGPAWEEMLAQFPQSKLEYLARAVRDLLADTIQTLPELMARDNSASLHIYFSNFSGMRKHLFPTLVEAYGRWQDDGNPRPLREAVDRGRDHWHKVAGDALNHFAADGLAAGDRIIATMEQSRL